MKYTFLVLAIACSALANAQPAGADNMPDSILQQDTNAADDQEEAGGVSAGDAHGVHSDATSKGVNWLWPLIGGIIIGTAGALAMLKMNKKVPVEEQPNTKVSVKENELQTEKGSEAKQKTSAAEVKSLKAEIKQLKQQVSLLNDEVKHKTNSLEVLQNFDKQYYAEVFKKIITPLNDAMEKNERATVLENLVKAASHFSSIARYKIAKKQPYDETNINYLLNKRGANPEIAIVEVNAETPLDKTPKNVKVILDLLKEQGSSGLDETIIVGHKIKNI